MHEPPMTETGWIIHVVVSAVSTIVVAWIGYLTNKLNRSADKIHADVKRVEKQVEKVKEQTNGHSEVIIPPVLDWHAEDDYDTDLPD